ncbi:MAG TPA: UDP-N-acetylmuramoyl-L-alanyl-D-glutamate--2,6-diaminopimelate ligase [Symbiobacteriaceae bacterium]|nr:UDP-N-acetylmuramoyl-L-alanyl-D-glutamate--2,6-diaminopimelate ligase [Symbiobacteriaceae bacterium]
MKLSELAAALGSSVDIVALPDREIRGITSDSRQVNPGDLFVSIPGTRVDAHQFIGQAIERGAAAVVATKPFTAPEGVGALLVPDARLALSALADRFYGSPSRRLRTVGITGTNGKTTIAFLVQAVAEAAGRQAGIIGTAGMMLGRTVLESKSGYTTPEAPTAQRLLAQMVDLGADLVAMEVTSHALEQHRVAHCRFDVAVYTNLTHEHLDYHKDMESYFAAKAKLFHMLKPGACAVINIDDPYGARYVCEVPDGVHVLTYGFSPEATVRAENVHLSGEGVRYRLVTPVGTVDVEAPYLFGAYNIANALAAIATGISLGYSLESVAAAMRTAKGAPGRFERVDCGQDFTVVVDYAHTPDGFEKLLRDVAKIKQQGARLTMVFGSAGHRDQTKRPDMGRIAGNYCDQLILTEEDPRTEDAMEIARQIAAGVAREQVEILMIEDRVAAIDHAIAKAEPGDIVLITGKGNETELEVQHPTEWHGDVPAAEEALRRLLVDPTRRRRVTA